MRDKFLTEAMGECWHEEPVGSTRCPKCNKDNFSASFENLRTHNFSTWQGFGKLWEWAQEQDWWRDFIISMPIYNPRTLHHGDGIDYIYEFTSIIHPNRFADALYEFLKERT